jgi:uncharacterized protein
MNKSGHADIPLHGGKVPYWLARRMKELGGAITQTIVQEYGREGFLQRLSDPLWFQSFGCVMGMDWHSSGITTSVMGALKGALNPMYEELGIMVCGGRGKHSLKTPDELQDFGEQTGNDGKELARMSRLSAKVDNTAIQDGFQLYLHNFIVTQEGEWVVIQQGMRAQSGMARRYHWHSVGIKDFTETPHTAICGKKQSSILNLTAKEASPTKQGILNLIQEDHPSLSKDIRKILMPRHHDVRKTDVDLKRLGAVLAVSRETPPLAFEDVLLTKGLGPRTLQSLVLVSEVIHGTPSRFEDPARFSFAHGGKDGHPFPVPLKVYDETISAMRHVVNSSKIQYSDKSRALKSLHSLAKDIEKDFRPDATKFDRVINEERRLSSKFGGRTVMDDRKKSGQQLPLF